MIVTRCVQNGLTSISRAICARGTSVSGLRGTSVNTIQVAYLTAPSLVEPQVREKPWPYKERTYNQFWQFFDHTSKRFNDNTRLIVVDGNIATGKTEFAKKIADSFDLHYIPDIHLDEIFIEDNGFDMRDLDEQFTSQALVSYDLQKFLSDPHPEISQKIGRSQLLLYEKRYFNYVDALEHILNTGQGVVMERSVFSDFVFPEIFTQLGYMRPEALHYYKNIWRKNTICDLWKPQLVIYLEAPVATLRERINARGNPYEVNSPVLTDDFLNRYDLVYKQKFIPTLKEFSEIISYDITNLPDWEIIVEELEDLNLVEEEDNIWKFKEWRQRREDDFNNYRMVVSMRDTLYPLFIVPPPVKAPELMISGEDLIEFEQVINDNPSSAYEKGYDPAKGSVLFKM